MTNKESTPKPTTVEVIMTEPNQPPSDPPTEPRTEPTESPAEPTESPTELPLESPPEAGDSSQGSEPGMEDQESEAPEAGAGMPSDQAENPSKPPDSPGGGNPEMPES